jgi:uncharacterized protein YndB with AHSA1/START domain
LAVDIRIHSTIRRPREDVFSLVTNFDIFSRSAVGGRRAFRLEDN